jgi:hypothetical protein
MNFAFKVKFRWASMFCEVQFESLTGFSLFFNFAHLFVLFGFCFGLFWFVLVCLLFCFVCLSANQKIYVTPNYAVRFSNDLPS